MWLLFQHLALKLSIIIFCQYIDQVKYFNYVLKQYCTITYFFVVFAQVLHKYICKSFSNFLLKIH